MSGKTGTATADPADATIFRRDIPPHAPNSLASGATRQRTGGRPCGALAGQSSAGASNVGNAHVCETIGRFRVKLAPRLHSASSPQQKNLVWMPEGFCLQIHFQIWGCTPVGDASFRKGASSRKLLFCFLMRLAGVLAGDGGIGTHAF